MILSNFKELHKKMISSKRKRCHFNIFYNKRELDIIFFTDESPYHLLIGAVGTSYSVVLPVNPGYILDNKIENDLYKKLCKVLGIRYVDGKSFKPSTFFSYLNDNIPFSKIVFKSYVSTVILSRYYPVIEDSKRIYFLSWLDNDKSRHSVSQENLEKTRTLLGYEEYLLCKKNNISSRWTNIPHSENTNRTMNGVKKY